MEPGDVFPNDSRMDDTSISSRLAAARAKLGLSQEALACLIDISSKSIYRYEAGEQSPSRAIRAKLAEALGVTERWIEYGTDALEPEARIVYDSDADPLVGMVNHAHTVRRAAEWRLSAEGRVLRARGIIQERNKVMRK